MKQFFWKFIVVELSGVSVVLFYFGFGIGYKSL